MGGPLGGRLYASPFFVMVSYEILPTNFISRPITPLGHHATLSRDASLERKKTFEDTL